MKAGAVALLCAGTAMISVSRQVEATIPGANNAGKALEKVTFVRVDS